MKKGLTSPRRKPLHGIECRGQDLNLHDLAATRPSTWRVCQFRHLGNSALKRGQAPLCEAPFGPFRQRGLTPFQRRYMPLFRRDLRFQDPDG